MSRRLPGWENEPASDAHMGARAFERVLRTLPYRLRLHILRWRLSERARSQ